MENTGDQAMELADYLESLAERARDLQEAPEAIDLLRRLKVTRHSDKREQLEDLEYVRADFFRELRDLGESASFWMLRQDLEELRGD